MGIRLLVLYTEFGLQFQQTFTAPPKKVQDIIEVIISIAITTIDHMNPDYILNHQSSSLALQKALEVSQDVYTLSKPFLCSSCTEREMYYTTYRHIHKLVSSDVIGNAGTLFVFPITRRNS